MAVARSDRILYKTACIRSIPSWKKNRLWSEEIRRREPGFFATLSRQQAPEYLWIGCSDSRVPANEICGLLPR